MSEQAGDLALGMAGAYGFGAITSGAYKAGKKLAPHIKKHASSVLNGGAKRGPPIAKNNGNVANEAQLLEKAPLPDSSHLYGAKVRERSTNDQSSFILSDTQFVDKGKKALSKKASNGKQYLPTSRTGPRYEPGMVSGGNNLAYVKEGDKWFRGTEKNAAKIPKQIADKMKGMKFKNFDQFRRKFWKLVADDPVLSKGFGNTSINRMFNGKSPC